MVEDTNKAVRSRCAIWGNFFDSVPNFILREYHVQISEIYLFQSKSLGVQSELSLRRRAQQAIVGLRKDFLLPLMVRCYFVSILDARDEILSLPAISNCLE